MAILTFKDNRWQWAGTARERYLPKAAGFRWAAEQKVWWTQDVEQALLVVDYADQAAKDAINRVRHGTETLEPDPIPRPTLTMTETLVDTSYIWRGVFETRELPKGAGFDWDREEKVWRTQNALIASKLIEYADEMTAMSLRATADHRERSLSGSHAVEPSEGFTVPANEDLEYMSFQLAGIEYAAGRAGTLIGDEMGLGKTIQALGLINLRPSIQKVLVICPNSVLGNWRREAWRWLIRLWDIEIANRKWPFMAHFVIVPYSKCAKFAEPMKQTAWDLVVLDEAHYIKNPKAQRTQAVIDIKARQRLALTGTPILNRIAELKCVLKWLDESWTSRKLKPYVLGWRPLTELQEKLRESVMIRRLKRDVLQDLPAKRRQIVALDDERSGELVGMEREAWESREEAMLNARINVEISKASDDPKDYERAVEDLKSVVRVAFEAISKMRVKIAEHKMPHVALHVTEAMESEQKIVVMCAHHVMVDGLREALKRFNPVVLDGRVSTNPLVRQELTDRFQKDDECRVFIGSIRAAGEGITLTASSTVVFGELDWVPAMLNQAEDRCHRIGQQDSVLVQHIVLAGSLDERMATTIIEKQKIADAGLDDPIESAMPALHFGEPASWKSARKDIGELAASITETEAQVVHGALRTLAAMCDGAAQLDDHGFNKVDAGIGRKFAEADRLTARQAIIGLNIAMRYRKRQLPAHVRVQLEAIKPRKQTEDKAA